jgi:hypothetical protein
LATLRRLLLHRLSASSLLVAVAVGDLTVVAVAVLVVTWKSFQLYRLARTALL